MALIILTPALCWAAGTDAGNRSMKAGGRAAWSRDDHRAAYDEYYRLMQAAGHGATDEGQPKAS